MSKNHQQLAALKGQEKVLTMGYADQHSVLEAYEVDQSGEVNARVFAMLGSYTIDQAKKEWQQTIDQKAKVGTEVTLSVLGEEEIEDYLAEVRHDIRTLESSC